MIISKIGDTVYRKGRVLRADLTPDCENPHIKYLDIPYEHVEATLSVLHQSQDGPIHPAVKRLLEEAYEAHIECRKNSMKITVTVDARGKRYYRQGGIDDVQLGWAEIVLEELDIPEEQLFHMAVTALEMGYSNITKHKEGKQ